MAQSATEFGQELFSDFSEDDFFKSAFKPLSWTSIERTGDILTDGSTVETTYSGLAVEQGAGSKKRMVSDIDGISMTDVYVKCSFADFDKAPELDQRVTYNGEEMLVVYVQPDPVLAVFDLFLRA